jgi:hypothetical protein
MQEEMNMYLFSLQRPLPPAGEPIFYLMDENTGIVYGCEYNDPEQFYMHKSVSYLYTREKIPVVPCSGLMFMGGLDND